MNSTVFQDWFGLSQEELVQRLRSIAHDIEALNGRTTPSRPTIIIDDWALAHRAVPCLIGRSTGHPTIEDGSPMYSSELFYLDEQGKVARSFSRWYRLGNRVDPTYWNNKYLDRQ